jgi:hypothetical protein
LFVIVKNFPIGDILIVPIFAITRYFWHFVYGLRGRGKAAEFQQAGLSPVRLLLFVIQAHFALLARFPALWKARRHMKRRFNTKQYRRLIRRFSISPRQVAAL